MRTRSSMLVRFFAPSGISKRYFRLDLAPMVPGLSRAESKAYEFLHAQRTHPRVRARDHQNLLRTLVRETLTNPISEGSTYAVPQSVGMFAIKGSTTTFVKHDSAPGGAMIGADVIAIFI